ncbi:MAG: hypothetical protein ACKOA8_09525 [Deltaproteobacteria bacterium]
MAIWNPEGARMLRSFVTVAGLLILSSVSFGETNAFVRQGEYRLGKSCKVNVQKDFFNPGAFEIQIDQIGGKIKGANSARFIINFDENQVITGPNLCGDRMSRRLAKLAPTVKLSQNDRYTLFQMECGETTSELYGKSLLVFDKSLGELTQVGSIFKVASYAFPNGYHSGPIKTTLHDIECSSR